MKPLIKMQKNELRIGSATDKGIVKSFWERGVRVGFGKCYEFQELKPVLITEQWLLKFGFNCRLSDNEFTYSNGCEFTIGRNEDSDTWFCYEIKMDGFSFFKHVHQLQNLFFALTQKELEIK